MTTRKNALKPVEPEVTIEKNMMVLKFAYDLEVVLTLTNATIILKALEEAYRYNSDYNRAHTISPLDFSLNTQIISGECYRELRRNHLLGVNDATDE